MRVGTSMIPTFPTVLFDIDSKNISSGKLVTMGGKWLGHQLPSRHLDYLFVCFLFWVYHKKFGQIIQHGINVNTTLPSPKRGKKISWIPSKRATLNCSLIQFEQTYRGSPPIRGFWDLKKPELHEIRVSGTVGGPLLTRKSPTCTYISQKPW